MRTLPVEQRLHRCLLLAAPVAISFCAFQAQNVSDISGGVGSMPIRNRFQNFFQPGIAALIAAFFGLKLLFVARRDRRRFHSQISPLNSLQSMACAGNLLFTT
jgi:hypothetical protein